MIKENEIDDSWLIMELVKPTAIQAWIWGSLERCGKKLKTEAARVAAHDQFRVSVQASRWPGYLVSVHFWSLGGGGRLVLRGFGPLVARPYSVGPCTCNFTLSAIDSFQFVTKKEEEVRSHVVKMPYPVFLTFKFTYNIHAWKYAIIYRWREWGPSDAPHTIPSGGIWSVHQTGREKDDAPSSCSAFPSAPTTTLQLHSSNCTTPGFWSSDPASVIYYSQAHPTSGKCERFQALRMSLTRTY